MAAERPVVCTVFVFISINTHLLYEPISQVYWYKLCILDFKCRRPVRMFVPYMSLSLSPLSLARPSLASLLRALIKTILVECEQQQQPLATCVGRWDLN